MKKKNLMFFIFLMFYFSINLFGKEVRIEVLSESRNGSVHIRDLRIYEVELKINPTDYPVIILKKNNGNIIKTDDNGFNWYPYSIDEINGFQISVYPNPVDDILFTILNSQYSELKYIEISDAFGLVSQKLSFTSNEINSIDVSKLPKGVYLLKLLSNGEYQTVKFFKN